MLDAAIAKWQDETYETILKHKLADFLESLGLDLSNSSMLQTPDRVIKFFINELFFGLDYHNFPSITPLSNDYAYKNPLFATGITVNSTCEHHLVPITGLAMVGYIPNNTIVGLSKLNRVIDFFARRPQMQERLTRQIFITLTEVLHTEDIAIAINATHDCVAVRGIGDPNTNILTLECGGKFLADEILQNNFYQQALAMRKS